METLATRFHRFHDRARPVLGTCLCGLVASLAAVAFQLAINWIYIHCLQNFAAGSFTDFVAISLVLVVIASLIAGWLLYSFCPEAAGSGIPQVKLAYWKEFGYAPRRIASIKFVAGVLSIGAGFSLGREGPTVQIGSNLASTLSGWLGVSKQNRRAASAAGAAAGLAAAFNAPLASVAFVLEEIIGDLNSRSLGPVLLAAVIGAFIVHACIGAQPAFTLATIGEPSWRAYVLMPVAAAFAAAIGIFFQWASIWLRGSARKVHRIPRWLHPLIGGLITWAIAVAVFHRTNRLGVFALGYDDLSDALLNGMALKLAALLLIGKLIATIAGYGLGGCGGIFSPNLFFGGMAGAIVADCGAHFLALTRSDSALLAVGAMSACLGAVVQAPVTAILIIFEMTHQFALVPGLMIAGLVSQLIARSLQKENFYDQILVQDGHQIEHLIPPRDLRSWQNLPISAIANFRPAVIDDLSSEGLQTILDRHPYRFFPVIDTEKVTGMVARTEIEHAIKDSRAPDLLPVVMGRPGQTIREAQSLLIESASGSIVLTDRPDGKILAVVTLHDLVRAQLALAEREPK